MQKTIFIAIFLTISFLNSFSQTTFGDENIIVQTDANNPKDVMTCDIDGDGDQDIISVSSDDGRVAWYENTDGVGSFSSIKIINNNADGAESIYCADIDNDGDMDVLSASDKIAWYENLDGNGNFSDEQIISESTISANCVYVADFDADGDQDVLSASSGDYKVVWYENTDGNGNFSSEKIIDTYLGSVFSVIAADIDGDGDQDVITGLLSLILWYENTDGNGTFGSEQSIESNPFYVSSIETTDMDQDGDIDIICTYMYSDKIVWFENTDGTGTFGQEKLISNSVEYPNTVYVSDIDNDGDPDLLSASHGDDKIAWYENTDGLGTFGEQQIVSNNIDDPASVYSADLDGDGDQDVVSAIAGDNMIAWYENIDGSGSFGEQNALSSSMKKPFNVVATDFDGDGDTDVLSAAYDDNKIAWFQNVDGYGTYGSQNVITDNDSRVAWVNSSDLDGDGDKDVLSASSNNISWYENIDGLGNFGEQVIISSSIITGVCVFASDLDGDGDQDVLSASYSDNKIAWYENLDGEGTFGEQQIVTAQLNAPETVHTADLDGDGDQDILSASSGYDGNISWYENIDGPGNFDSQIIISENVGSFSQVYTGDIDGDGDMDVISASMSEGQIAWYENIDGNGTFGEPQVIATDPSSWNYTVYATDLDGDGDTDVLSGFTLYGRTVWYENLDGKGNFSEEKIINNSSSCHSVIAADIDDDGDKDVISVSRGEDKISWYKNLTDHSFIKQNSRCRIKVYPNPTKDILKIDLKGTEITHKTIVVLTDVSGKQIYKEPYSNTEHQIDLSNLKNGIYFISIQANGTIYTKKIVIE